MALIFQPGNDSSAEELRMSAVVQGDTQQLIVVYPNTAQEGFDVVTYVFGGSKKGLNSSTGEHTLTSGR